ncbi:DUF2135 domain-containing protein [Desulfovibrio sp. OttesenSCG-928-A18]|nr:DUF2135 domain-containing protein [Desulfovibrio sp. OttesenSCG-928-A18]
MQWSLVQFQRKNIFFAALALMFMLLGPFEAEGAIAPQPDPAPRPPLLVVRGAEREVQLSSLAIQTTIQDGFAESALEMVFSNPNDRILEGELRFPLRPGQAISGLALDINGEMRQASVVEKARGQEVFEEVTRQQVDPALLEAVQGDSYRLRLYPIPAKGSRRVLLRVMQPLSPEKGELHYTLPLGFAGKLDSFALEVRIASPSGKPAVQSGNMGFTLQSQGIFYSGKIEKSQVRPEGMLDIRLPAPQDFAGALTAVRWGDRLYFSTAALVQGNTAPRALPSLVTLLWDASGSGAGRDHAREYAFLDGYCKALGNAELRLILLRDVPEAAKTFSIKNGDWTELKDYLRATVYDGGTNLTAWKTSDDCDEYLLFSDGLSNFGPEAAAWSLPQMTGKQRLFAVNSSMNADSRALRHAARSGAYIDLLQLDARQALNRLLHEGLRVSLDDSALAGRGEARLDPESASAALSEEGEVLCRLAGWIAKDAGSSQRTLGLRIDYADGTSRQYPVALPAWEDAPKYEAATAPLQARLWGGYAIAALEGEYKRNKKAITRLGQELGLVSRATSLIVLETAEDYARYNVTPPPELKAQVQAIQSVMQQEQGTGYMDEGALLELWRKKVQWWESDFTAKPKKRKDESELNRRRRHLATGAGVEPEPVAPGAAPRMQAPPEPMAADSAAAPAPEQEAPKQGAPAMGIQLRPWTSDAPYIARMRDSADKDLYAVYLDEKPGYSNSSAFFLDAADRFFERGMKELGLRVLSNIAELDLENRRLLRMLAYRLIQADEPALALAILEQVLELAPYEPQSMRDLALAHAALGNTQKAVDLLHETARREWPYRFGEINTIALTEMNALIALSQKALKTDAIHSGLLVNLPVDLRVVLSWDTDNTDMDLWVTDPGGEATYYENPLSGQGGSISRDCIQGYGPEEFMLKKATPGVYKVEVNYYGSSQQVISGEVSMLVTLFTNFGTPQQKEERITVRLKETAKKVLAGEFTIGSPPQ